MSRGLGALQRTLLAILAPPGLEERKHGWRASRTTTELTVLATDNPPVDEIIIACDPMDATSAAARRIWHAVEGRCVSGKPTESNAKSVLRALNKLADEGLVLRYRDRDGTISWAL